jgi:hypothetical protein
MNTYNEAVAQIQMPERIRRLPISDKGYPIPWFVATIHGEPDFRVIRPRGMIDAIHKKKCWVCGEPLGRTFAFTLGPMCAITRTNSEPPSHVECAIFSAKACPFLSNPRMRRNEKELPEERFTPGMAIPRNPGAVGVWVTRSFKPFSDNRGNPLIQVGDPINVWWFAEGRNATRKEVTDSIESGIPILKKAAELEKSRGAMEALSGQVADVIKYLPLDSHPLVSP